MSSASRIAPRLQAASVHQGRLTPPWFAVTLLARPEAADVDMLQLLPRRRVRMHANNPLIAWHEITSDSFINLNFIPITTRCHGFLRSLDELAASAVRQRASSFDLPARTHAIS